ncbi:MAG: hypothetical protein KJZ59_00985 [Pararhodobacter sp.]|nr:hypothetical protein [Pararhodobacter sp.]
MPGDWDDNSETPEDDLWFLPGPPDDEPPAPPGSPPLPRADNRALFDVADWQAAQDAQSLDLARLAQVFGELDFRLRQAPAGVRFRLALREAADLSWWTGDRLPPERLGLWVGLRVGSTADTEQALARAGWAVRRLAGGPAPGAGLADFLERREGSAVTDPGAVADLADLMATLTVLHPVVQAAVLFHAWRMLGEDRGRDGEAAVLAARHAADMRRLPGQGALFLPLATTGPGAFRGQGDAGRKLASWLAGAEQATLAALLDLDRLADWRARAGAATADLSGRTPGPLLDVFESWPQVTAPLVQAETGASRAAIQRNLDRLAARGLIREVTGQGRYRVWGIAAG